MYVPEPGRMRPGSWQCMHCQADRCMHLSEQRNSGSIISDD